MDLVLQYLIIGVMVGAIYGLMALGIVLIYKSSGIFNFAQGAIVGFTCYLVWSLLHQFHLGFFWTCVAALAAAAILGIIIQYGVIRPLVGQPLLVLVMATLALSEVISGIVTMFWPGPGRRLPEIIPGGKIDVSGIILSYESLISFGICLLAVVCIIFFFQRTRTGVMLRAASEDHQLAQSEGMKINRMFAVIWIISIIVCVIGGILVANLHGVNFEPLAGLAMKALPVVILGGLESVGGAIIAGYMMGVLENIGAGLLDPLVGGGLEEVFPFIVMVLVLLIRPYGLFGYEKIERV